MNSNYPVFEQIKKSSNQGQKVTRLTIAKLIVLVVTSIMLLLTELFWIISVTTKVCYAQPSWCVLLSHGVVCLKYSSGTFAGQNEGWSMQPAGHRDSYMQRWGLVFPSFYRSPPKGLHWTPIIYSATVPLGLITFAILFSMAILVISIRRSWSPRKTGTCRNCDYDLFGIISKRCPECGVPIAFR